MQKLNITIDMQEHADMLNQKLVAPVFFFSVVSLTFLITI